MAKGNVARCYHLQDAVGEGCGKGYRLSGLSFLSGVAAGEVGIQCLGDSLPVGPPPFMEPSMSTTDDDVEKKSHSESLEGNQLDDKTEKPSRALEQSVQSTDERLESSSPLITDQPLRAPGPRAFISRVRGYQVMHPPMGIWNKLQFDFHGPNGAFQSREISNGYLTTDFALNQWVSSVLNGG